MDIATLERNLVKGSYGSRREFVDDVRLIFRKCREFNDEKRVLCKYAHEVETYIMNYMKHIELIV